MKTCIIAILAIMIPTIAISQQTHEKYQLSLYGTGAFPLGDFKETISTGDVAIGLGGGFNFLLNPKGKQGYFPLFLGGDFTYLTYGRDKQPALEGMPPLKTTFNYYGISGMMRYFLSGKTTGFIPFLDAQGGMNIVNTRTKVDKDLLDFILDEDFPEVLHSTDEIGLLYGFSIGFYTRKPAKEGGGDRGSFSLKASYVNGTALDQVVRGTLKVTNGNVTYETTKVKVSNITIQLGYTLY